MNINEAKNQTVHYAVGAHMAAAGFFLGLSSWPVTGIVFSTALTIEILQYFFADGRRLKLADRIMDISFYIIGARVMQILIEVLTGGAA